ncbi:hypothetical protein [Olivibacter domesticus]|uniref:Uncharacterized protein n=1 Tax=Olivibacter domesticus TaxID=407022 RepID=A0A1H7WQH0_OLID1|nr:hypothetical protein [Olivibacter domesticus]SEM23683.1 hypothetical protein SAMN05661044_04613 [Olivibacter domesticus]
MKILFLYILLPIFCLKTNAVELQNTDELEKLFKRYADSTLIFRGTIPLADAPENLFIMSKKGDTVNLFTYHYYQGDIPRYPESPDSLAAYITKEKYTQDGISVDPFFEVSEITQEQSKKLWNALMKQEPWQLEDDAVYGSDCSVTPKVSTDTKGNTVEEYKGRNIGSHSYFVTLITKEDTKQLSYYAPEDLEKVCPPKDGRKRVIKIKELILKYFSKNSVFWKISDSPD